MSFETYNPSETSEIKTEPTTSIEESPVDVEGEAVMNEINKQLAEINENAKIIANTKSSKIEEASTKEDFNTKVKNVVEIASSLGLMGAGFATVVGSSFIDSGHDSIVPTIGAACLVVGAMIGKFLTNKYNETTPRPKTVLA